MNKFLSLSKHTKLIVLIGLSQHYFKQTRAVNQCFHNAGKVPVLPQVNSLCVKAKPERKVNVFIAQSGASLTASYLSVCEVRFFFV